MTPDGKTFDPETVTDKQLVQYEQAIDRGLTEADAMRLTEHEYNGFQANAIIAAALNPAVGEDVLDALATPKYTAAQMTAIAKIAIRGGDFARFLDPQMDARRMTGSGIPTREEVRSHFAEMGFAVDPDRFFDVNEGRGWRTNSGKPVDDWKKLAAVWDRNEHPKTATPPARTEPKANAVGKIPSVEEVMAKWGCDRETAQGYIDENMY